MPAGAVLTRAFAPPWLVGALLGLGWGVAARAWMAFITEHPLVTVSGTAFIVGGAALIGLILGVIEGRRRAGGSRRWKLLSIVAFGYLAGPGIVLLPALVLGGFALSGRGPRWGRALTGAVPVLMVVPLVALEGGMTAFPRAPLVALTWYLALSGWLAFGGAELFRSWPARVEPRPATPMPGRLRRS